MKVERERAHTRCSCSWEEKRREERPRKETTEARARTRIVSRGNGRQLVGERELSDVTKLRARQTAIDRVQLFQEGFLLTLRHVIGKKMGLAVRFRRELLDGQRHGPHVNQRFEPFAQRIRRYRVTLIQSGGTSFVTGRPTRCSAKSKDSICTKWRGNLSNTAC